jgi:hypothetical protein
MGIKKITQEEFIEKINLFYGQYNYDFSKIQYINSDTKVQITCPHHGSFLKIPYTLFKNKLHICKHCKKEQINIRATNIESFIKKSNLIHNSKYDYSKSIYVNNLTPLIIQCNLHGEFSLSPEEHISVERGCPKCKRHKLSQIEVLERFKIKHKNKYKYPDFKYNTVYDSIQIKCEIHGIFKQKITTHLNGHGCPKCGKENIKKSPQSFIERSKVIHHNKNYDYTITNYKHSQEKVNIICPKHGVFSQIARDHLLGMGCWECSVENREKTSSYEKHIIEFINSVDPKIKIHPSYSINRKEIDIYLPDFKLGIEFNGNYWHSHLRKKTNYHKEKSKYFKELDINIFHIWEHAWINKNPIIKSMIINKLNLTPNKIYARKCIIKEINSKTYRNFTEQNHIQGFAPSKIKLGLFYDNILVGCMGLGKLRTNLGNKIKPPDHYELIRYCNLLNYNIIGGASKLLKYFEREYNPKLLISYADNDYSTGHLYETLNFQKIELSKTSYVYYNHKTHQVENRFKYRKSELIKLNYSKDQTEFEITHQLGLYRLHNSGITRYEKHY